MPITIIGAGGVVQLVSLTTFLSRFDGYEMQAVGRYINVPIINNRASVSDGFGESTAMSIRQIRIRMDRTPFLFLYNELAQNVPQEISLPEVRPDDIYQLTVVIQRITSGQMRDFGEQADSAVVADGFIYLARSSDFVKYNDSVRGLHGVACIRPNRVRRIKILDMAV